MSLELRSRSQASSRNYRDTLSAIETTCASQVAEIDDFFRREKERINSIYQGRLARVQRFFTSSLRNLPRHASEARERWIGNLQMRKYNEQRKLASDVAASEAAYGGVSSKLESFGRSFFELERRARKQFRGYGTFRRQLRAGNRAQPASETAPADQFDELASHLKLAGDQLDEFTRLSLPRVFRYAPLPLLFFLLVLPGAAGLWYFGPTSVPGLAGGIAALVLFILAWFFHHQGFIQAKPTATAVTDALGKARQILAAGHALLPTLAAQHEEERRQLQEKHEAIMEEIQQQWGHGNQIEAEFSYRRRKKLETQAPRISEKITALLSSRLGHLESDRTARIEQFNVEAETQKQQIVAHHETEAVSLAANEKSAWEKLEADWKAEMTPIYAAIEAMNAEAAALFPAWTASTVEAWTPPDAFIPAAKFGHLEMDLSKQPAVLPKNPRLALPGPAKVSVPLALSFPYQGSLLFETSDSGATPISGTLNNIILRLLATTPPGKLSFTVIDPVGLGQNFAGLMYLADYQETLINHRIWTQRDQIEEKLAELSEHIEKVIQMYLRNEYETITEYNEQAGSIAEKYHFLVIADFPANFSEAAGKRLQSIVTSGARCGIYTLIHWDQRQPAPEGIVPDELRRNSICLRRSGNKFILGKEQLDLGADLGFDPPPEPELAVSLVHKIGQSSVDSNRVEVPFTQIAPKPDELWTGDTTNELRVAIGRTGATKFQYLALGKGTRQHVLIAGKTGSGKSTLFHVIITNLALACSPEQVEFYLIDFKKGVEFKCYATRHLPHAKVVAIESDREFALSVLQRVDGELRRRGDMFRKLGAQDIAGYKRAGGTEPMPRTLLMIDEFQEFFVQDDAIAQSASLLLDRIVRQGRAFGIHVLLGSQTLGGAYSLARATLGQMAVRIALQCNEADSYLIMDENNAAPRLLSRPGEGIYNDAAGAMEGNSPFQVVWLPDDERDQWLDQVNAIAGSHPGHVYPHPVVFEGNAPADVRENDPLRSVLERAPANPPAAARCWLGAPNSIKGPTEIVFQRQSGSHLLIVGQRGETGLNLLGLSVLALAAQYPRGTAKFTLLTSAAPGSSEAAFIGQIAEIIPHEKVIASGATIPAAIHELASELKARTDDEAYAAQAPAIFLCIHGMQKFRQLRHEDDFSFSSESADAGPNTGAEFNKIITEGSSHGIHILVTVDTLNSVNHFMNRKALSEFAMRIVFQMSANDSASLIDSPQASELGLHRALYFNEHEGYLETFRPYAAPDSEWLRQAADKLALR